MNAARISSFRAKYGPVAVVTGASSGIGRAIAKDLAGIGLDLLLVARNHQALNELTDELKSQYPNGQNFSFLVADLSTPEGIETVLEASSDLDVGLLVTAAGFGTAGNFIASDLETELSMLAVNCCTPLVMIHHFAMRLVNRGGGGIILFGSLVGFQGAPRAAHYAATKAYIQTFAEGLHYELKDHQVDVLTVAPGPVQTGFAARSRMKMGGTDRPEQISRGTLAALGKRMSSTPGPLSKFLTYSLMTAPRSLRVRIMGKIMQGMTQHLT